MAIVFRRETFIALRARRQAHRIASEILNPLIPQAPAGLRDPTEVIQEDQWYKRNPRKPTPRWLIVLLIIIDLTAIGLIPLLLRYA